MKKIPFNSYFYKNLYGLICMSTVLIVSFLAYAFYEKISFFNMLFLAGIFILAEIAAWFFIDFRNRKKESYVTFDNDKIIIVKNNRKVEYLKKEAKLSIYIPKCIETISFGENYTLSSLYFNTKDFEYIKSELKPFIGSSNDKTLSSCSQLNSIYKILLAIIAVSILLYFPFFGLYEKLLIILVVIFVFNTIYTLGQRSGEDGCKYAIGIAMIIVVLIVYQVILGDPTNLLGTGIDLTKIPHIDET